jgi:type II secretory pathway pseudopilin PulG
VRNISNFKYKISKLASGFTVVELLLYMGLLAIFLTIISQIFVASIDTQLEAEAESSIQQDSKFILARMQYDLQNASSISEPPVSGSSSGMLQFVSGGLTKSYQLNGTTLEFSDGSGTYQLNSVTTRITDLSFTRRGVPGGKPYVTAVFTVTSVTTRNSGPETQTFQTTLGIR